MNLYVRDKCVQLIFWNPFDAEDREHIGFGTGRWPRPHIREIMSERHGKPNYGFRAFVCGPFEIRYWPSYSQTTGRTHS
jgi:hypothetical protein